MIVGVCIATLNRPELLRRTLDALRAQTYTKWRAIIIDQSAEPSYQLLAPQLWRDDQQRQHVVDSEPYDPMVYVHVPWLRGSRWAWNLGVPIAEEIGCDAVCWWGDDDHPTEDYLERMVAPLLADGLVYLTKCDVLHHGKKLPEDHPCSPSHMLRLNMWGGEQADGDGPGQDARLWNQFSSHRVHRVRAVLYVTGNSQSGGHRDPSGRY